MKSPLKIFRSKSNFFHQPGKTDDERIAFLSEKRKDVDSLLLIWGYELSQRHIYLDAFDYFAKYPKDYNGASMTEDLGDIPGLDLDAMLHDYLYVVLMACVSWKYQILADKLFRSEMRRREKSSWNRGYRFIMLMIKTPFWIAICWVLKGRRITDKHKKAMDGIFRAFHFQEKKWYLEFKRELIWTAIFLVMITSTIFTIF